VCVLAAENTRSSISTSSDRQCFEQGRILIRELKKTPASTWATRRSKEPPRPARARAVGWQKMGLTTDRVGANC